MESHPILAAIAYLMSKGSPLERANKIGRKFTDGFPEIMTDMLNLLASEGSILNHKAYLLNYLPKLLDMSWINKKNPSVMNGKAATFQWFLDSSRCGYLRDGLGNCYTWSGTRSDGSINYRCTTKVDYDAKRCTAVARRIKNEGGNWLVLSMSPHTHNQPELKRKMDDENNFEGI